MNRSRVVSLVPWELSLHTFKVCTLGGNTFFPPLVAGWKDNVLYQYDTYIGSRTGRGRDGKAKISCLNFHHGFPIQKIPKYTVRWYRSESILRYPSEYASNTSSSILSRRQVADFEEFLYTSVGSLVKDPVLGRTINDLKWMNKRIATSRRGEDGTIVVDILLKLPSLLHPSIKELQDELRRVAQEYAVEWFNREKIVMTLDVKNTVEVNVAVLPEKPISAMAKLLENPTDLLSSLGPGLTNVSHVVAVYSCKVC
jgi:hypothetical protein